MAFVPTADNFIKTGWLFQIGDYYLSTISGWYDYEIEVPYDPIEYDARIISDSFSGVTMRVDMNSRLMQPNEVSFEIDNADGAIDIDDLNGEFVKISLLLNCDPEEPAIIRAWKFYIKPGNAKECYGKITVVANDILWDKLKGVYPNTQTITAISNGDAPIADSSACAPKTFGIAYIPVAPAMDNNGKWHYVLGDYLYTGFYPFFIEAPKEFGNSKWEYTDEDGNLTTPSYDLNMSEIEAKNDEPFAGMQAIIADSDDDGDPDSNMVWVSSGVMQSPRVRYIYDESGNGTGITVNKPPGRILYYILSDFFSSQIEAAVHLNFDSFDAADLALAALSDDDIYINHGFFQKEDRESLVSEYLANFDCFLSVSTTINLHVFSATSVETFSTEMMEGSFSISNVDGEGFDGGEVTYCLENDPDDAPTGRLLVPLYEGQDEPVNPSQDVFRFRYRMPDQSLPMIFGQLWFQKKYDISHRVSFAMSMEDVTRLATIVPGQVVTVAGGAAYGPDAHKVLITQLEFTDDLQVVFSGDVYFHLNDSSDLTPTAYTLTAGDGSDFTSTAYTVVATNDATSSVTLDAFDVVIGGRFKSTDMDAFQAYMTTDQTSIAEDTPTIVEFDAETNDNTDAFDTDEYTYTAQGDGWRQFNVIVRAYGISTDAEHVQVSLVTSQETFSVPHPVQDITNDTDPVITFSQLAYMDDEDTAYVEIRLLGGSGTVGVLSGFSFFSGFFVFNTGKIEVLA